MVDAIKVGIADLNVVLCPKTIMTIGLGSCIGIALYDRVTKVAGLSHIMLPDSTQFKNITNPMKFADLAVPILIDRLLEKGCSRQNITAKIAGGASMFNFTDKNMVSRIGERNGEAVIKALEKLNIPIVAKEIGGNKGRTMIVYSETGQVVLKVVGGDVITL